MRVLGDGSGTSWTAIDGDTPVGAVTARVRPDRRTFLVFRDTTADAYRPLAEGAALEVGRPLYATAPVDGTALAALMSAGFEQEVVFERFRVRFDAALSRLRRARLPAGFVMVPAADADEVRLFALDNTLRHDVPGTDGWRGDREWFRDELADPAAYLAAVDEHNGAYVGLARIWRNDTDHNFGLVGVVRRRRRTTLAAALCRGVLEEAAGWGDPTFVTGASPSNPNTYPALLRVGGESLGRSVQVVLR